MNVKGAEDSFVLHSTALYKEFRTAVADLADISPKSVEVAYRWSTSARSSAFKHLRNEEQLHQLMQGAKAEAALKKNKSKAFSIELKAVGALAEELSAKIRSNAKSSKNSDKKKKKVLEDH